MGFTPIIPTNLRGNIDETLLIKAENVLQESAVLTGSHTRQVLNGVKELLRTVNSYYSSKIESEGTHIVDIERAMRQEYFDDAKRRNLQILSLAHIKVQREVEAYFEKNTGASPYSKAFILKVHKDFYSHEGMESFLHIAHDNLEAVMVPGKIRTQTVKVSGHIAPQANSADGLMGEFEHLYNKSLPLRPSLQLIHALSSHHRLMWIHPFLDGNGRTARLALDGAFVSMGLRGYGLWNISRGLSRRSDDYKTFLRHADMIRQGEQDGRGDLSSRALEAFVDFMLDTALDQIDYMGKYLKLDELTMRMERFVARANDGLHHVAPLPRHAEKLFQHLLLTGECARGEAGPVIGMKERSARTLVSQLVKDEYLTSDTPKGAIRLKFNSKLASHLFPDLVPETE